MVEVRLLTKSVFDIHRHNYSRGTQIAGDADDKWGSPVTEPVPETGECHVTDCPSSADLEAVGIKLETKLMSTPI